MYIKLALRNVKRSAKDYLIYMLTLILTVGLFYGFLSITSPSYNSRLPIQMNLEYFSLREGGYTVADSVNIETYFLKDSDFDIYLVEDMPVLAVSLSDFNAVLRLDNQESITLPDGSFAIAWENTALPDEIEQFEREHPTIQVGENIFSRIPGADYQVDAGTDLFANKKKAVYILPDVVCDTLTLATSGYNMKTTQPLSYDFAKKMAADIAEWLNGSGAFVHFKTLEHNEGISNSLMIRLGGTYTSLVLIIICLTVLALQQLTDATEHKQRFGIIGNLGVDQRQIGKYIKQQMSVLCCCCNNC